MVNVTSVVCARNENASTIIPAVRALRKTGKVYLVDDGGNSGLIRARLYATVIPGPQTGKTDAMLTGLAQVKTERVIFADADLTGFSKHHARRLAEPHNGMIVGLRDNGSRWLGPWPPVSGERSLPASIAEAALRSASPMGAETAINAAIGNSGLTVSTFVMKGVTNPSKEPLKRTGQVAAAASSHLLGLIRYLICWLKGAVRVH